MDAREETLTLLNRIWVKLQNLPNANAIELGAFFILLTFILMVALIMVLACINYCCCCCRCCCRCKSKKTGADI